MLSGKSASRPIDAKRALLSCADVWNRNQRQSSKRQYDHVTRRKRILRQLSPPRYNSVTGNSLKYDGR
jgi:hypothetical protein